MAYTDADRRRDWGFANGTPNPDLVRIEHLLPWKPRWSDGRPQAVYAHRKIAARFCDAANAAVAASSWRPQRTDSYNERPIRGSDSWSLHSWAIAWDIFATPADIPPPGGVWTPTDQMPPPFVKAFTDRGFTWGGHWTRRDTPHMQWSGPPPANDPLPEEDMTPQQAKQLAEVHEAMVVGNSLAHSVAYAVNQVNYSVAGIGNGNLREFIGDLAAGDSTPLAISAADRKAIAREVADLLAQRLNK